MTPCVCQLPVALHFDARNARLTCEQALARVGRVDRRVTPADHQIEMHARGAELGDRARQAGQGGEHRVLEFHSARRAGER